MRSSISLGALLACIMLASGITGPGSAAADEPMLCQGEVATIVGVDGEPIVGTDGRDVVLTNGSQRVDTRTGDDLICTTDTPNPASDNYYNLTIEAGPGTDVVDRSGDSEAPGAIFDAETVIGGTGPDLVAGLVVDVATGSGNDQVYVPGGLGGGARVDLGPGNDAYYGTQDNVPQARSRSNVGRSPGATIRGGTGSDIFYADLDRPGVWKLDLAKRRLADRTGLRARFRGFDAWTLVGENSPEGALLDVAGSNRADVITTTVPLRRASLKGGSDQILLKPACRGAAVRGGSGADVIKALRPRNPGECRGKLRAFGGAGPDNLRGGFGKDLLDGGPGQDTARGGPRYDTCPRAEKRVSCERPR